MARVGEYFFMIFLTICTSFFEKVLFSSVSHFFIGSLIFGEFNFLNSLYIVVASPLSDVQLVNIFSYSVGDLFNLETISFVAQVLSLLFIYLFFIY
jgi:hypothetical protein